MKAHEQSIATGWEIHAGKIWTWIAARVLPWAVLVQVIYDAGQEWLWPFAPRWPWGLAPLFLAAYLTLFVRGLKGAPRGWGSWPYMFSLGAALGGFLLGSRSFVAGLHEGYAEAMAQANGQPAPSHLIHPPDPYEFWNILLVTLALGLLFQLLRRRRDQVEEQARLLEESRGLALQSKLAPHFIFNALNTLHAQIDPDPAGAKATTERLAQLFRQVLAVADRPVVSLKEELDFVEAYLGIERARMGDRLSVSINVPEDLEACPVPPLSLQVLVENAVKHGVAPLEAGGEIRVAAWREGKELVLIVRDPGQGRGAHPGTGSALKILRQRLAAPADLWMEATDQGHEVGFRWRVA